MVKGSNDERLVIRMPRELREWIDVQADAAGGLDAATWVRMRLMQEMRAQADGFAGARSFGPPEHHVASLSRSMNEMTEKLTPVDPATLDALIEQGLATAEAQGLTAPVESPDDGPPVETVRLAAPPRSGDGRAGGQHSLVGGGAPRPW